MQKGYIFASTNKRINNNLKQKTMITKEQFTAQVERVNEEFAKWFGNQPSLVEMYSTMKDDERREFRSRMIGMFANEIMKNFM